MGRLYDIPRTILLDMKIPIIGYMWRLYNIARIIHLGAWRFHNAYNPMYVIRHDDESIQSNMWMALRNILPTLPHH